MSDQRHAHAARAKELHASARRVQLRRREAQQRRLAGAVRPEQSPVLALPHRPGDGVDDVPALAVRTAPIDRDVVETYDVRHYANRAGSNSSSCGEVSPRIADATSSPHAKPSTLPCPE